MFSIENLFNDIKNSDVFEYVQILMGKIMFSDSTILSLIPEEYYDKTLKEIGEHISTPWGMPFPSDEVVKVANISLEVFKENKWMIKSLWEEDKDVVYDNTKKEVCLFTPVIEDDVTRPAAIICAGGGYTTISMVSEGFGLAEELKKKGYRPFILRYRVLPNKFPSQMMDLTLALLHVSDHKDDYHIDPEDVLVMGFSAGGHLCASTISHVYDFKENIISEITDETRRNRYQSINPMPQKMCLGYAVLSFMGGKFGDLLSCCEEDEKRYFSATENIPDNLPKTYAWACEDDPLVPVYHTIYWGEQMEHFGKDAKTVIFKHGGHGIALGYGTDAEGWLEDMEEFYNSK